MVCPSLCGIACRALAQYPVFAPGSSEMAVLVGIFFFLSFCIFWCRICPRCPGTQLFLVLYCFFVFCSLRRAVSRYKHCSRTVKSPGTQPGRKIQESKGFVIAPFHRHVIHTRNIHPPHTHIHLDCKHQGSCMLLPSISFIQDLVLNSVTHPKSTP